MVKFRRAECFPPSLFIEEDLEARGKELSWLLKQSGKGNVAVADVMQGKHMTPRAAVALSRALGGSTEFWFNLDALWRQWLAYKEARP